jgi:hypothetical protein
LPPCAAGQRPDSRQRWTGEPTIGAYAAGRVVLNRRAQGKVLLTVPPCAAISAS